MTDRRELARQALEVLADIPEEQWITHYIRHGSKCCALGHLGAVVGLNAPCWSRLARGAMYQGFYLSRVNDGEDPHYPHPTPKQRVCEYLLDVYEGKR